MSSVRVRKAGARIVAPSMLLAALAGCLVAVPAAGPALADATGSGSVNPPSPTGSASSHGSTYVSSVGGNYNLGNATPWTPPPCWMEPYFSQTDTWKASDPSGQPTDADSYASWYAAKGSSATPSAAQFQEIQDRTAPAGWTGPTPIESNDVWWAPDWLDSSAGYGCAQSLLSKNKLSNGDIGLEPPLEDGQQSPLVGAINVLVLSKIALASITLPKISIITSPSGTKTSSAVVNTPTYVAVEYQGDMDPTKTDTSDAYFGFAPIWASVQATISSVAVTATGGVASTTGFNDAGQTCAAVDGKATSACSVTFNAPSGSAPDNLQVAVTWKVTWSTSAGTGGTFPNTGAQQATKTVVVNEIQSAT